jgi:hypothetical protein
MRNALSGTRVGNRFERFGKLGKNRRAHCKLRMVMNVLFIYTELKELC